MTMPVAAAAKRVQQQNSKIQNAETARTQFARWAIPVGCVFLTFLCFLPTVQNEFLNWDDEAVLVSNAAYRGLGWTQLQWMFTTFHHSLYRPLTWITFALDYVIWGMNPLGYHLTSLLFHCACALVFYFVAYRILALCMAEFTSAELPVRWAAGFATLLFALHPLRVEAVAWASGRENVVSGLFFLLTILFYLKAVTIADARCYRIWICAAWIAYLFSLLGKAAGMTLSFALLILDVYPLRRLQGSPKQWFGSGTGPVYLEKLPFFALAAGAALLGWMAKYEAGAAAEWSDYGLLPRLGQSFYGLWFYMQKALVPVSLSPLYELPLDLKPWIGVFVGSALFVIVLSIGFFLARWRWPGGLASWLYYIVILAPVLGIAQSGPQLVADRYSYLGCLSWPLLAGAGLLVFWRSHAAKPTATRGVIVLNSFAIAVVALLGVLTWRQTFVWRNSESLWTYVLGTGQKSTVAHFSLGVALDRRGQLDAAIREYREALEIKPNYLEAHKWLAKALIRSGRPREAIEQYKTALAIYPVAGDLYIGLGNLLAMGGDLNAAVESYRKAVQVDSRSANGYFNLANVFVMRGDLAAATRNYREALRINPDHAEAHFNLANVLVETGIFDEALNHYREALRLKPNFAEAYHSMGRLLAAQGRLDLAIECFRQALQIRPDYREAEESLRQALAEQRFKQ